MSTKQGWQPPAPKSQQCPPDGQYKLHITSVEQKPSTKGDPMDTFKLEIIAPDHAVIDGQQVNIAGFQLQHWNVYATEGKAADYLGNKVEFAESVGADTSRIYIDPQLADPAKAYVAELQKITAQLGGMTFMADCKREVRYKLRAQTPEEKLSGAKPTEELDAAGQKIPAGYNFRVDRVHKGSAKRIGPALT